MKIIELVIDETDEDNGIEAISIVENPAIEEDFVALKSQEIKFAEADKEKKILIGALLTPNKPIFRRQGDEEYYIYFSRNTVRKASQMYLKAGNQSNSTLEHSEILTGLTLVESWIVEDKEKDKSTLYNMNVPLGTWMGAVKVDNDEVWNDYVKTGKVKGFSIEGYFADKMERPQDKTLSEELQAEEKLNTILSLLEPQELEEQVIDEKYAIIDDRLAYSTQEKAEEMAINIGCVGFHTHDIEGKTWYMPCEEHIKEDIDLKKPCWNGYEMIGTKMLNGKKVPNCVKIK